VTSIGSLDESGARGESAAVSVVKKRIVDSSVMLFDVIVI
jgi:hypothetical protein